MSVKSRQTGTGVRWDVRLRRPDGSEYCRTFRTKREADEFEREELGRRSRGLSVDHRAGQVLLEKYAWDWLLGHPTLAMRTRDLYEQLLRAYVLPPLGQVPMAKITPAMVRTWNAGLVRSKPGTTVPAKAYRVLRVILNTAVADEIIIRNPCMLAKAGQEKTAERPVATPEQVWRLADAIEPRYRALILLAGFGGLRWGELLALTRKRIDLEAGTITVEEKISESGGEFILGPPKTEAGRRKFHLPSVLIPELRAHIDAYAEPGPDGRLFPGPKGAILRRTNWSMKFRKATGPLGLDHLHFHDLRHTANTIAASAGASTKELMHRMGHASTEASMRYLHATQQRDDTIAQAISGYIEPTRPSPPTVTPDEPDDAEETQ